MVLYTGRASLTMLLTRGCDVTSIRLYQIGLNDLHLAIVSMFPLINELPTAVNGDPTEAGRIETLDAEGRLKAGTQTHVTVSAAVI